MFTGQNDSKSGRKKRRSRWGPQEEYSPLPCDLVEPTAVSSDTLMYSASTAGGIPPAAPPTQPGPKVSTTTTRPPG